MQNFYMDDYLDSFKHHEEALKRSKDLIEFLKLGEFKLTKIVSNVSIIKNELSTSSDELSQVNKILGSQDKASHGLGLKWDHIHETIVFSRGVNRELKSSVTHRTVLTFVSSVFDPIWLVTP